MTTFEYATKERFADVQMLRYRLNGFENLTLRQKEYIYYLSEATLWGRDITFDQNGRYNLQIRRLLEQIYTSGTIDRDTEEFRALETYLKRVWFSNGIYHHYGCEKFMPDFSPEYLRQVSPLGGTEEGALERVIFDPAFFPKRVNKADGEDLVVTSACNFYDGVTQQEVEQCELRFPLNSTLVKRNGRIEEDVWRIGGRYGETIAHIVHWLRKAQEVCENEQQHKVIGLLISYYETGDPSVFDAYCIEWVRELDGQIDFINGFIEVYGDPLGLKATWEGLVEYKDLEATKRTQTISSNAQWFEDHSPVDPRFRKPEVKGVTANVICAAMLGGEEYPSTAIGINLPNADWIRAQYGSKSITIGNITEAYNRAAHGNGFQEEFVIDEATLELIRKYGDVCDDLHTDLHECLGHGSGQLLPGTDPDALKAYGNTIEEARADLFALYYIADPKLVELGLTPDMEAYKSQYYTYMMNGLMTQLTRIKPGHQIEEAHMRNRALIARWCYAQGDCIQMIHREGKTFVSITDYDALRGLIARLLAEVQRIKSEGDYEAARRLVEQYAISVDEDLHAEVLRRYERLNLAPYKGFINPVLKPVRDSEGSIIDITVDYSEDYAAQMLRYSREYSVETHNPHNSHVPHVPHEPHESHESHEPHDIPSQIKEIKQSFRQLMDGKTAQSMRDKGLNYKINWGASLPMLREKAEEIKAQTSNLKLPLDPKGRLFRRSQETSNLKPQTSNLKLLAIALWKEDVRECKILATMLMPADEVLPEVIDIWMEQMPSQEMAEQASLNLFQHLPYAAAKAYQWMASDKELEQLCGFHVLTRLFMNGQEPNERGINEYLDQLEVALQGSSLPVRKAAMQSVRRFAELGLIYERMAKSVLKRLNLDFL